MAPFNRFGQFVALIVGALLFIGCAQGYVAGLLDFWTAALGSGVGLRLLWLVIE